MLALRSYFIALVAAIYVICSLNVFVLADDTVTVTRTKALSVNWVTLSSKYSSSVRPESEQLLIILQVHK